MTLKIWKPNSEQVSNGPSVTLKSHGVPQVPFINVVCGTKSGIVLLENPAGFNKMTSWQQVNEEISGLFESPFKPSDALFNDEKCSVKVSGNVSDFSGRTLFLSTVKLSNESTFSGACCPFVNINLGEKKGCLLLQNPFEQSLADYSRDVLNATFGVPVDKINGTPINEIKWDKVVSQSVSAS